jgi:hypothetical protein
MLQILPSFPVVATVQTTPWMACRVVLRAGPLTVPVATLTWDPPNSFLLPTIFPGCTSFAVAPCVSGASDLGVMMVVSVVTLTVCSNDAHYTDCR